MGMGLKCKIVALLEENIRENLHKLESGGKFL